VHGFTKPGLSGGDEINPAIKLLAEVVVLRKDGPVLVLGSGNGALGVALARQGDANRLCLMETNWAALRVARMTLAENGYATIPVVPLQYPLPSATYQTVVIHLPKGRKLARRWLVEAWDALREGGELYLAGANPEGIQSVIQDAGAIFGNATVLKYRKGCRAARMVKARSPAAAPERVMSVNENWKAPAWAAEPGIARGSWFEYSVRIRGMELTLRSLPGVFSYNRVDEGTALLLQQISPDWVKGKRVLDFGCGYGVIGLSAAQLGAAWVDMLDVDLAAVASAQENCLRNQVHNAQVRPSDVLDGITTERYDMILSNPPFHAGKEVDYAMAQAFIGHAQYLLPPGGRLVLVANRFIRYDRLMKDAFGNVNRLVETGKFHVLESIR
jgi:16S rRNA (guanine1207-N2)-methyltransferase